MEQQCSSVVASVAVLWNSVASSAASSAAENTELQEALRKPLDLLYSNVRGARGKKAEEIDFDA